MAQTVRKPLSGAAEAAALAQGARRYGLDPAAVLAVASVEEPGLTNHPGDNNTSFGPFQLHQGGALNASPGEAIYLSEGASAANDWANSPEGIDYGLQQEAQYAHGLSGAAAVHAIVYLFERPGNKPAEESTAMQRYAVSSQQATILNAGGKSFLDSVGSDLSGAAGAVNSGARHIPGVAQVEGIAGGVKDAAVSTEHAAQAAVDFVGNVTNPVLWERALYIIGGGILMFGGLLIVARELGAKNLPTSPLAAAAKAVS